jgi:hypothetical protein
MSKTDEILLRIQSDLDSQHPFETDRVLESAFPGYHEKPEPPKSKFPQALESPVISFDSALEIHRTFWIERMMLETGRDRIRRQDLQPIQQDWERAMNGRATFRIGAATRFALDHGLATDYQTRTTTLSESSRPVIERPKFWHRVWLRVRYGWG